MRGGKNRGGKNSQDSESEFEYDSSADYDSGSPLATSKAGTAGKGDGGQSIHYL